MPATPARRPRRLTTLVARALALCGAPALLAAQPPAPPPPLDSALVAAFSGRWRCAGAFANGRPIASDVAFTSELDGRWLLLRHDDRAPQRWRALGLWGADTARTVRATLYDNTGGPPRTFVAPPWDGHTLRLEAPPAARRERFVYEAPARDSLAFAYEVSTDGVTWRLGDRLACRRAR